MEYDFSGWATKANLKCSDGRIITKDAFKHNDGMKVPLIWMHKHGDVVDVLGHAMLENREEGVYAYCKFNETESGKTAKQLVEHGDIDALSIYANQLKQNGPYVMHGNIREVSLVLAGANPGASIQNIIQHSDDDEVIYADSEANIFTGENLVLFHSDDSSNTDEPEDADSTDEIAHADEKEESEMNGDNKEKTAQDVIDSMTEEQKNVMYTLVEMAREESGAEENDDNEEEGKTMKHNVFENDENVKSNVLTHADEQAIVELAKQSNVGSFKMAMSIYAEENNKLEHGAFESYEALFPEYELLKKGEPDTLERDQSWVATVMQKIHKSPISRIRTRQADARIAELRAKGYQNKGDEKKKMAQIKLLSRTTDPQTIYIKDDMHRDDIIDIVDFDVVSYQWKLMRNVMNEELAIAALIGDGRDEGDPDKIHESHIRSIWNDDDLYTIHTDVDIEKARTELQGTNTSANFGENYIYAEAIITAALYSREKFKGSGTPDLYCTPHLLNVMLLARDLNGRRIYESKSDLAAALNVGAIHTVEQFEGKTRTTSDGKTKKLLGLFVNLADYQFGSTKGGEITKFEDFDMDFNKYKYMLETRLSGSLTKVYSAIALEEPVAAEAEESGIAG